MNDFHKRHSKALQIKIAILTGASLAWNPRAFKEATALVHAGFDVVVYGSNRDKSGFAVDEALARFNGFLFESAISVSQIGFVNHFQSMWSRLRNRFGRELFTHFAIENRWQLGPLAPDLLSRATATRADYYIVHLEQAAWVGGKLLSMGYRVGVDMEDWFSEDLLPEVRKQRPIRLLRDVERKLLQQGAHATCPSKAMSQALAWEYGCSPPTVIYNAFRWSDRQSIDGRLKDRRDRRIPSVYWYSQTLGDGRGLEDLLAALPYLGLEVDIHLRGNPVAGFDSWLAARVPNRWRHRIFVHGLVPNQELLSRIVEHDIGFAGEMKYCRNKDLTVSNKILHYLLGGLAVVASDTTGQREVAELAPDAVLLYLSGNAATLAAALTSLLASPQRLQRAKGAALRAAERTFCWERQEKMLIETIARVVGSPANQN
jgi:glycosyltransferase involved in cell wall biosynthesis